MTEPMHSALVTESSKKAKDGKTRTLLLILVILWLGFVTYLIWDSRADAAKQQAATLTYAEEIQKLCDEGLLHGAKCGEADKVVKNDGEIQTIEGPQGPQGPRGSTGPQGPEGPKGDEGKRGPEGQNGSEGPQGLAGLMGAMGLQGPQGSTGSEGPQGSTGPQGPEGPQGSTGPEGPKGEKGDTGVVQVVTVGCDGPVIQSVSSSYDAETQTITISCNGGETNE